jgi:NADP-dependent 3-hydroxy acid dehydrogenase YdfG
VAKSVAGKVVIVTGASSGIGAATAHEFARQGAQVVLAARRIDKLEEHARRITDAGGRGVAVRTDITDPAEVARLVERAREAFGPVDILVNSAGANWAKPLAATQSDEAARILEVNLLGPIQMVRAVLPDMQRRASGTIISVGSVASHVAIEPLYSAAKFGVRGFSLALRRQTSGTGISVSLISPGNIRTQMTSALQEDMPGPDLVAGAIVKLALNPRREVILPPKYRAVIWLDRLFPRVADFAFHWRHRHETTPLPAYARSTGEET